jgi:SAM-dependent methyltransferase
MTEPFRAYSDYYDAFYADKDYGAEAEYVVKLLRRYGVAGFDLLDFGSGTGRHARCLVQKGYRVTGIERSSTMVARAVQLSGFESRQGDIRVVDAGRKFDAVLSLFHVISYQVTNADVRAVFSRAAAHLNADGLFIFDVWYTPAVYSSKPTVRIKRVSGRNFSYIRVAEPTLFANENRVDVLYSIIAVNSDGQAETFKEMHPMRHFSLPEIDLLAHEAGFERVAAEEFLSGAPPSESTWGICLVLRRTNV